MDGIHSLEQELLVLLLLLLLGHGHFDLRLALDPLPLLLLPLGPLDRLVSLSLPICLLSDILVLARIILVRARLLGGLLAESEGLPDAVLASPSSAALLADHDGNIGSYFTLADLQPLLSKATRVSS